MRADIVIRPYTVPIVVCIAGIQRADLPLLPPFRRSAIPPFRRSPFKRLDTARPPPYTFRRTPTAEPRIEDRGSRIVARSFTRFTLSSCHLVISKEGSPMSSIQIEQVHDKKGVLEFVEFPFRLYRGDPSWVPPLIEERRDFLDPKKNPFFEHASFQLFLARRGGDLVGTIGAVVDKNHNEYHSERMAAFGFFECIDNQEVADALLGAAEGWGRAQGMSDHARADELLDQPRGRPA